YFNNEINCFYPGKYFPSISLTDNRCSLKCSHCNGKYLAGMISISDYNSLIELGLDMEKKGAIGILISGGCDFEGKIPLENYINEIKELKEKTHLFLNLHTGLITPQTMLALKKIGVDSISFDVIGDENTIKSILHLNKTPKDYYQILRNFKIQQLENNVIPHICLGLNKGKIKGEFQALEYLKPFNFKLIVLIIFTPTKGTILESYNPPSIYVINRFMSLMRLAFPKTELSLGCMRPRKKLKSAIDELIIKSGFNRIVMPSTKLIEIAKKNGIKVVKFKGCCCIPKNKLDLFYLQ
ncbi:MAG: radical SAM protein, partial [Candidatus Odinarchaeia archaeon]